MYEAAAAATAADGESAAFIHCSYATNWGYLFYIRILTINL